ncbi:unnamed protein product [Sympodiomycopsis kandeliae]
MAAQQGRRPPSPSNPVHSSGLIHSNSKNQRLANALSGQIADSRGAQPYAFPPRSRDHSTASQPPAKSHDSDFIRSSISTDTDEQFQDVEDEFQDTSAGPSSSRIPREPPSPGHYLAPSGRASVDTHWDESEFQRQAADRSSKYSTMTRYDGADEDEEEYGHGSYNQDRTVEGDEFDGRSTYGHTRTSSVGSSIFAGKGAIHSTPTATSSRKKKQPAAKPPPLPTSSAALQQLRERGEVNPLSPTPFDATPSKAALSPAFHARDALGVTPNEPPPSGLSSAYNSPNPQKDSSKSQTSGGGAEFDLVNDAHTGASSEKKLMPDGTPYPPLPPIPSGDNAAANKGSSGRKGRSPILSYDGGVEAEERIINSPQATGLAGDGLQADGNEVLYEGAPKLDRTLSHIGPKLRKNEPAPWEMDTSDDVSVRTSPQSNSTSFPASPNTQSAWSKLTRGSLDVREKDGSEVRRGLGLGGVNLRRPSGDMGTRPSGETTREGSRSNHTSPKSKSRFKHFGSGNSPHPPAPSANDRESSGASPNMASREIPSANGLRPSPSNVSISLTPASGSSANLPLTPEGRDSAGAAAFRHDTDSSRSPGASSNASLKPARTRTKSVTNSAANVFKGLGLGGDKKDKQRDEGHSSSGLNSNKLAKALKKKGERDELSLAKGISSEDFVKQTQAADVPADQDTNSVRASSVQTDIRPAHTAFDSASVRAAVNKDLVNPFSTRASAKTTSFATDSDKGRSSETHPRGSSIAKESVTSRESVVSGDRTHRVDPSSPLEDNTISVSQAGMTSAVDAQTPNTAGPVRVASPRAQHREMSLTASSMSSIASAAGPRQTPTSPNLGPGRGMGIGYRNASGGISPSPTSGSSASFGRLGRRQESSGSVGQESPIGPRSSEREELNHDLGRNDSAISTPSHPPKGYHSLIAQQNMERRQGSTDNMHGGIESVQGSTFDTSTASGTDSLTTDTQSSEASSAQTNNLPYSHSGLPTPGSHEGVAYKLISLEQAQAQHQAKTREAALQRAASQAGGQPGTTDGHQERDPASYSHGAFESFTASSAEDHSDTHRDRELSGGKGLKNKKSGILRMFGRGDKHNQGQEEQGKIPSVPAMPLPNSTTLKSMDTSSSLHPSYSTKNGLSVSASAQTLSPGANNSLQITPPALDEVRPVSSMFASMSPGLLDNQKGDRQKVSKSPSEALAALQGDSVTGSTEELSSFSGVQGEGEQHDRGAKLSALASARGQSPSAIKIRDAGLVNSILPPGRSPSVASTNVTAADASDFYSPASSPMGAGFGEATARNASEENGRHGSSGHGVGYSGTRPLQLVDRQGTGRKVSASGLGAEHAPPTSSLRAGEGVGEGRRSSTFSSDSELSRPHFSAVASAAGSHSGSTASDAVRLRVTEIEARMAELVAELSHLRSIHAPGVSVPPVEDPSGQPGPRSNAGSLYSENARLAPPTRGMSGAVANEGDLNASVSTDAQGASSPVPDATASSPMMISRSTTPVPPCSSCGCKCAEMKRLQAVNEVQVLKNLGSRSPGSSVLDRGRGVKKRPEDAGRFGA